MAYENCDKQRPTKRRHVQGMLDETEPETNYFRGPQIQMQTEAELSLEEIKEREEAIRKLEVQKFSKFSKEGL